MISALEYYLGGESYGDVIWESADEKLSVMSAYSASGFYVKDINIYLVLWENKIEITDLTNAFKTGKQCDVYTLNYENFSRGYETGIKSPTVTEKLQEMGITTLRELYEGIQHPMEIQDVSYESDTQMGVRTYSPFVKIKPIAVPKKWNRAHIWKAILAGQIYRGVLRGVRFDPEDAILDQLRREAIGKDISQSELLGIALQCMYPPFWHEFVKVISEDDKELVIEFSEYMGRSWNLYFRISQ